jgi:hypothetical protein
VRTDDLDFMAPSEGYQTTDEASFSYTTDPSGYKSVIDKQFFLQLSDGKYARMDISVAGTINLLAYINPTPGDRNLEPASN